MKTTEDKSGGSSAAVAALYMVACTCELGRIPVFFHILGPQKYSLVRELSKIRVNVKVYFSALCTGCFFLENDGMW